MNKLKIPIHQLLAGAALLWGVNQSMAQYVSPPQLVPGVDYNVPNYAYTQPLTKFVDSLPGLGPTATNNLGQYIPVAQPMGVNTPAGVPRDGDYYEIAVLDYFQKMHSELLPTKLRGYVQIEPPGAATPPGSLHVPLFYANGSTPITVSVNGTPTQVYGYDQPRYLGPVISSNKGTPTRIKFYNLLAPTATGGSLFIPTDTTLMGAGVGPNGANYSENRATIHLHGGDNPWISDGTAHQWITPAGEAGSLLKGASQQNVPDMPVPPSGSATFYYPNGQSGRLMFYHDHALGMTRLDVYAGEVAGYLLSDPTETALNTTLGLAGEIPLIFQDKTFVNSGTIPAGFPAGAVAPLPTEVLDPLWTNNPTWSQTAGSLWFPHVYMPNQNPNDISGANPLGRWDYGAWFWPIFPSGIPPQNSSVPESFMDTPLVNGVAYPNLTVQPTAYRLRMLNGCNDRYYNLQMYVASPIISSLTVTNGGSGYVTPPMVTITPAAGDTTGKGATADAMIDVNGVVTNIVVTSVGSAYTLAPTVILTPAFGDTTGVGAGAVANLYTNLTEVGMVPAIKGSPALWPPWWSANDTPGMIPNVLDGRMGGVPDPNKIGPSFIHIGSEGGIAPQAVELKNTPIGYEQNKRSVTVLNTYEHTLFLGPAERADVIVDFSKFGGKTIIVYNDSPAPVPAGDPRNDFYTCNPDTQNQGGAPSTAAGFGPNTRTIMQINVAAGTNTPLVLATINTAVAGVFAATQPTNVVPAGVYARIADTSMTFGGATTPLQPKTIQELFDPLGRMNSILGVELPFTTATIQTTIPYGFADPPTEVFPDGVTQLWKITHNGVDTHAIHFHLFNVQVVNRVGWDGAIKPPWPDELGWKETVKMHPLEDIVVALRAKTPTFPFTVTNSVRPLNPATPLGSTNEFTGVDPNGLPLVVSNVVANFGAEYVWHCHLLGHEENDMMRAMMVATTPQAPTNLVATTTGTGSSKRVNLTWANNSMINATAITVQRSTASTFATALVTTPLGKVTSYSDQIGNTSQVYYYRVFAVNTVGSGVPGYPSASANSLFSNTAIGNAPTPPAAPSGLSATVQTGPSVRLSWTDNANNETGFQIFRAINGGAFSLLTTVGANTVTYTDTGVSTGNSYSYQVQSINGAGVSAFAGPVTVTISAPAVPAAPTNLAGSAVRITGNSLQDRATLTWTDNSNNETGFQIQRSTSINFTNTTTFNVGANTTTLTQNVPRPGTYYYRVRATNAAGNSAWSNVLTVAAP